MFEELNPLRSVEAFVPTAQTQECADTISCVEEDIDNIDAIIEDDIVKSLEEPITTIAECDSCVEASIEESLERVEERFTEYTSIVETNILTLLAPIVVRVDELEAMILERLEASDTNIPPDIPIPSSGGTAFPPLLPTDSTVPSGPTSDNLNQPGVTSESTCNQTVSDIDLTLYSYPADGVLPTYALVPLSDNLGAKPKVIQSAVVPGLVGYIVSGPYPNLAKAIEYIKGDYLSQCQQGFIPSSKDILPQTPPSALQQQQAMCLDLNPLIAKLEELRRCLCSPGKAIVNGEEESCEVLPQLHGMEDNWRLSECGQATYIQKVNENGLDIQKAVANADDFEAYYRNRIEPFLA